ncbi:DNA-binding MurR/RpiR family transcriptional regulator [Pararhizobium capsulatum DSM 1112]|uniref:DNA-binding MurR/RpiR family transcriptional regulator n=1 Tax=Pararhizobium capsulatum DSM 1112 TaxID=1121113 RepID=A0ABU0BZT3_9HYPH|nr:MurR/RpiR family transcriptional regulator [Pararhizobium capsulatum]MDQ0323776.1 DNA-binding MurR/RpiR family transcriptional regulator [Pararhizobium capsulatum DSM 1112]
MAISEKVQELAATLTRAEKKVVEAIFQKPKAVALGTAADLAHGVDVHEATVSRLVRKLGFESYSSFRSAMQSEFIPSQEPATRMGNSLARASDVSLLSMLVTQEISALSMIEDNIGMGVINDIARELMGARRIFLFGRGNAETLSLMMLKRLRRFGRDTSQLSGDPRELAEQALSFGRGDVVLIFAFRRAPRGYAPLIESIREVGAKSIVISGASGALLTPSPDRLIGVPRSGEQDAFQTLTVPMTVCNAIVLAAGAQHKEESLRMLDRLGTLIRRFE